MIATTNPLTAARAAALFVSDISTTDQPTGVMVDAAIKHALRSHDGSRGYAADVAAAYGDYPEFAARRMRWAISLVEELYERRMPPRTHGAIGLSGAGRRPARSAEFLASAA